MMHHLYFDHCNFLTFNLIYTKLGTNVYLLMLYLQQFCKERLKHKCLQYALHNRLKVPIPIPFK